MIEGDGPFVSVPLLPIDIRKKPSWLAPFTVRGLHRNIERIFERPLFNRSYDSQIQSVKTLCSTQEQRQNTSTEKGYLPDAPSTSKRFPALRPAPFIFCIRSKFSTVGRSYLFQGLMSKSLLAKYDLPFLDIH